MSNTIPFIDARFFSANEGRFELEIRLKKHLRSLRCRKLPPDLLAPIRDADDADDVLGPDLTDFIGMGRDDESRIKRRVNRILERRKAASGLEHLRSDDRARLEVLKDGARLVSIRDEHHADELAAALHADIPWMAPAT